MGRSDRRSHRGKVAPASRPAFYFKISPLGRRDAGATKTGPVFNDLTDDLQLIRSLPPVHCLSLAFAIKLVVEGGNGESIDRFL
jgi:hypothetical protein